jgi:hypothetical protein
MRSLAPPLAAAATPVRLLPSPLHAAGPHGLQTPSPVRIGASSFFATPGFFPGTPVSEAMAAASWLQELTARSPSEACHEAPAALVPAFLVCLSSCFPFLFGPALLGHSSVNLHNVRIY